MSKDILIVKYTETVEFWLSIGNKIEDIVIGKKNTLRV